MKKAVAAALVLLVAAAGGMLLFTSLGKGPAIKVDTPPGWQAASEEDVERLEKESNVAEEGLEVEYLFTRDNPDDAIVIFRGNAYLGDTPDSEELEKVEEFYMQRKDTLYEQFESTGSYPGVDINLDEFAVRELACGLPALFMRVSFRSPRGSVVQDYIFAFKDNTGFFALITTMGDEGNLEEVDFLTRNISFE